MKRIKLFGREAYILSKDEKDMLVKCTKSMKCSIDFLGDQLLTASEKERNNIELSDEKREIYASVLELSAKFDKVLSKPVFHSMMKILREA